MINRKGPFGCYATETLTQGVSVSEYAMAVIGGSDTDCFLPCIINRYGDILEFSFDYSGLIPISEFRRLSSDGKRKFPNILKFKGRLRKRRIAVGTFLLKIVSVLNDLIPAEGIELSPKHIYTNSEGTDLKCCYRPAVYKDSKMRLSSVDPHKMETLISTDFFSQVLTEDEKQTILHAISTGDEEMYYSICKILMSCQGQISRHESSANDRTRKTLGSFDKSMSVRTDLILPALVCVCALYSYISVGRKAALVFVFAGLLLTFRIIYKDRDAAGAKSSSSKEESNSKGDLRRRILFSKTSPPRPSEEICESDDLKNGFDYNIRYASIRSYDPDMRFSIYTDKVTIGSDRFLSDIVLDNDSVDSQHASITFDNDRYYLKDLSTSKKTFIDDKSLLPDRRYEIKNNQKLTFGDLDFTFKISSDKGFGTSSDID